MNWDPDSYRAHADHRLRPGLELMARIGSEPELVYDLGCGTGELTNHLGSRWPQASVIGIDNSAAMLGLARPQANVSFVLQSIEDWRPAVAPDLIFSNAALHWVGDHASLLPRLLSELDRGGVLAVQMPDNWDAPTHVLIHEEIARRGWKRKIADGLSRRPVATLDQYIAWLSGASVIDAWRTTYFQVMRGSEPVLSWVRGTVMLDVRAALSDEEYQNLESALAVEYRLAYPPRPDGTTIVPFSRIFLVVTR